MSCAPFKCAAGVLACARSCSTSGDCVGQPCVNGSCGTVANGSPCTASAQCTSGECVDGFCCDKACAGSCQACDVSGAQGTCTTLPTVGQPHGSRAACAGSGVCQGHCDGTGASCVFPTATCATQSCSSGTELAAASCNGAGSCAMQTQVSCGGFACNTSGGCYASCTGDGQCGAAPYCNTSNNKCQATATAGHACTQGPQCGTGNCVNDVCCTSASCPASDQCHTPGTCTAGTGVCSSSPAAADGTGCNDGNACTGTDTCQKGVCTGANPVTCSAATCFTATCVPASGCSSQAAAAGTACTTAHASASACDGSGTCKETTCNAGFLDCDGNKANGCETPFSVSHCGSCGSACTPQNVTSAVCTAAGACSYAACANFDSGGNPYLDCDGNKANGCEVLPDSFDNCGACGVNCGSPSPNDCHCNSTGGPGPCTTFGYGCD